MGYNCSSGLGNGTISFMQALLPNTAVVQSRLFADELTRPSPGCVVSADAVLEYYEVGGINCASQCCSVYVYAGPCCSQPGCAMRQAVASDIAAGKLCLHSRQ